MKKFLSFLVFLGFISGALFSYTFGSIRVSLLDITLGLFVLGNLIFVKKNSQNTLVFFIKTVGPFLLIACFSLLFQIFKLKPVEMGISALYMLRFLGYASSLYFVAKDQDLKHTGIWWLWLSGISISVLGLIQYVLYPNLRNLSYLGWDPHQYRLFSTLLDPNFTGIILVLTLILSMYIIQHKNTQLRIFVIVASFGPVIALFLTYSRGAFVAFLATVFVWTLVSKRWKIMGGLVVIFVASLFFLPRPSGEGVNLLRTISIYARIENTQEAWNLFTSSPVIGYGFNTLRFVRQVPASEMESPETAHSGGGFHNGWLTLLTTTGIIGVIGYLWIWRKILAVTQKENKQFLMLSLTAIFTHSFFDNSLFYPWVMLWMWVVAGSGLKINRPSYERGRIPSLRKRGLRP
ncbi:MAG: hypothetical protein UV61_C0002G0278 [Candidatus Gottesmanbacteria bacterium GW2011_GWB1_43_11]|uniref:O-antigen ligase-related domain-containing protein n=1 Tax=Candidatus Gottesmanbacteria bacterium GW2011_GWB1_43_11 TaxID=1618446 RepID=A0A0G1CPZ8_9BACT|nr:MAG: hypothetical protein UV04_C0001G0166 [Candidatus Gottesmanbacteria bacterium GW2011_GWA2_42_16]KKS55995.1 MAG: hypothetical protein UV17_C0004G0017 [Candidatus Gottesmanbacteria bacterium GW2011_GWA1_42_26]KKS82364.1 MAG: hypothetical protein UV55_C0003G0083 [Candidatus Gottesmanbacteria bacterium GW2011_GWC1_43_10]KKS87557.1 MAG: hypothetical protein UV61_C0002G0278 [Candidatus Gottesmanbacteria bacterium GW2011_GWB1_43_11]OGG10369.1 MAG: hypothetical protein A2699_01005 [Candidatus Go